MTNERQKLDVFLFIFFSNSQVTTCQKLFTLLLHTEPLTSNTNTRHHNMFNACLIVAIIRFNVGTASGADDSHCKSCMCVSCFVTVNCKCRFSCSPLIPLFIIHNNFGILTTRKKATTTALPHQYLLRLVHYTLLSAAVHILMLFLNFAIIAWFYCGVSRCYNCHFRFNEWMHRALLGGYPTKNTKQMNTADVGRLSQAVCSTVVLYADHITRA